MRLESRVSPAEQQFARLSQDARNGNGTTRHGWSKQRQTGPWTGDRGRGTNTLTDYTAYNGNGPWGNRVCVF